MSGTAVKTPILGLKSTMNDHYQLYLKQLFDRGINHQPNSEILTYVGSGKDNDLRCHRMKYCDFSIYCNLLASSLQTQHNIGVGSTVSTFLWNNVRHMALYYTIPCLGAVLNPLNIRLHSKELVYILSHSQPTVIFIDENLLSRFEDILNINPLNFIKSFVICGNHQLSSIYLGKHPLLMNRVIDYDIFINKYGNKHFINWPYNLDERSGCFLNYTSGTTGNPKGILNSHRSTSLRTVLELARYSGTDCILGLPAMFHACGWGMSFISMATGCKIILNNDCYNYNILLNLSLNEKVTKMCGVPTMIEELCNKLKQNPNKYAGKLQIKEIRCGGAVCSKYIIKYLYDNWNIELSHGWGMTECMPGSYSKRLFRRRDLKYINNNDPQNSNYLIQNQCIQGTFNASMETLLIDNENNNTILEKDGSNVGELLIRGPCIASNYYKMTDPKMKDKYFTKDGYLITGDIVKISPNEEMVIVDRSKDLIKSGGEWISSSDMENYVMSMSGNHNIKTCAVVSAKHPRWQERPILIIVKNNKKLKNQPNPINIRNHLQKKYAKFQLPDDILFWDEIPLTGTGKKSKKNIRNILTKQNYVLPQLRNKSKL